MAPFEPTLDPLAMEMTGDSHWFLEPLCILKRPSEWLRRCVVISTASAAPLLER
jgi:hypothetical protein